MRNRRNPNRSNPKDAGALTRTEIFRQPELWPTMLERVRSGHYRRDNLARSVLLTGAGTSAYAASAVVDSWPGAHAIVMLLRWWGD